MDPQQQPSIHIPLVKLLCVLLVLCIIGFLGVLYWFNHKNTITSQNTTSFTTQQTDTPLSITPQATQSYTVVPIELTNKAVEQARLYYTLAGRVNDISLTDPDTKEYQFTLYDSSGMLLPVTFIFKDDPRLITITKVVNGQQVPATVSGIKKNTLIQFSWNVNLLQNSSVQIANIVIEQQ